MYYITKAGVKFLKEEEYPQSRLRFNRKKRLKHSTEVINQTPRGQKLLKAAEARHLLRYPGLGAADPESRSAYVDSLRTNVNRALGKK
jgi:hypothetical protein